ncbi:MAG: porphobilinogen synthase, partial [Verrucomicrobia bacterium]|nr:porphobilinogen synthase [Verrucomicrobiota bacterium]
MLNLTVRPRRLRATASVRHLVREHRVHRQQLIFPLFVSEKVSEPQEVSSMPGVLQHSPDSVVEEARRVYDLGVPAILLFGIPAAKDEMASEAYA